MSQACRCGAPLGAAAVLTRPGAISVLQADVEVCARCAGLGEHRDVKPENVTPPRSGRR